ncbi:MAG: 50S ribosomal protein L32e [Candidatus Poseidoniaceae archaeon]
MTPPLRPRKLRRPARLPRPRTTPGTTRIGTTRVRASSTPPARSPCSTTPPVRRLPCGPLRRPRRPTFRRTEWFRYARLSRSGWRKPKGMDNKQRRNFKYRGSLVRIGHGKVAAARGLHPSGFSEVMVHNVGDLDGIDPAVEAARIGSAVGGRKRATIHARADELGIRVLNRRRDA